MIAVVDYHKGNLKSVERGLMTAGGDTHITDDAAIIGRADAIVLPGVGSFTDAVSTMTELGQMDVIRDRIQKGVPFLGICLGLHVLFDAGAEVAFGQDDAAVVQDIAGMGVLPGVVTRIPQYDEQGNFYKVPHVGWNTVEACAGAYIDVESDADVGPATGIAAHAGADIAADTAAGTNADADTEGLARFAACPILKDIPSGTYFYFTHSYRVPMGPYTVAQTQHSVTFPSVVTYGDAAFGVQFHPEKSSDAGVAVLRNFVEFAKGA